MVLREKLVRQFRGQKDPTLYRQAGRLLLLFFALGVVAQCVTGVNYASAERARYGALVAELGAAYQKGMNDSWAVVRRNTARECGDVAYVARRWYGLDLGTHSEWDYEWGTVGWAWEGDRCIFMAQHLPAPPSAR